MRRTPDAATFIIPKSRAASGSHSPPPSPLPLSCSVSERCLCTSPLSREREKDHPRTGPQGPCPLWFSVWGWFSSPFLCCPLSQPGEGGGPPASFCTSSRQTPLITARGLP